jgi:uncharacterized paraquat-inducible protein A
MAHQAACPNCETILIPVQRNSMVSASGIISAILLLVGLILLLVSPVIGLIVIIIGVLIGMTRSKSTWLNCPACMKDIVKL